MYDAINSKYTYKNTDVLKNKLNIKSQEKLDEYETQMVAFKLLTLAKLNFVKTFDEKHLRFIHQYLFFEIYDFAGHYRQENITKDDFLFSSFEYIEDNVKEVMKKVNLAELRKLDKDQLIIKISNIMTDLNVLHPFREGNGRTIREFARELFEELGYELNLYLVDKDTILTASKKAITDESLQIELLKKCVSLKNKSLMY